METALDLIDVVGAPGTIKAGTDSLLPLVRVGVIVHNVRKESGIFNTANLVTGARCNG